MRPDGNGLDNIHRNYNARNDFNENMAFNSANGNFRDSHSPHRNIEQIQSKQWIQSQRTNPRQEYAARNQYAGNNATNISNDRNRSGISNNPLNNGYSQNLYQQPQDFSHENRRVNTTNINSNADYRTRQHQVPLTPSQNASSQNIRQGNNSVPNTLGTDLCNLAEKRIHVTRQYLDKQEKELGAYRQLEQAIQQQAAQNINDIRRQVDLDQYEKNELIYYEKTNLLQLHKDVARRFISAQINDEDSFNNWIYDKHRSEIIAYADENGIRLPEDILTSQQTRDNHTDQVVPEERIEDNQEKPQNYVSPRYSVDKVPKISNDIWQFDSSPSVSGENSNGFLSRHPHFPPIIFAISCFILALILFFAPLFNFNIPMIGDFSLTAFGIYDFVNNVLPASADSSFTSFFASAEIYSIIGIFIALMLVLFGFGNLFSLFKRTSYKSRNKPSIKDYIILNIFAFASSLGISTLFIVIAFVGNSSVSNAISSQGEIGSYFSGAIGNVIQITPGVITSIIISIAMLIMCYLVSSNHKRYDNQKTRSSAPTNDTRYNHTNPSINRSSSSDTVMSFSHQSTYDPSYRANHGY